MPASLCHSGVTVPGAPGTLALSNPPSCPRACPAPLIGADQVDIVCADAQESSSLLDGVVALGVAKERVSSCPPGTGCTAWARS